MTYAKSIQNPKSETQFKKEIRIDMKKLLDIALKEADNYRYVDKATGMKKLIDVDSGNPK